MNNSTAARRQVPDDVAAWLRSYEPRSVPGPLWHGQLRGFIVPAVIALGPVGISSAGATVRVLTQISAWALSQGMPLSWERILDPDCVERYVSVGIKGDPCRGTYRAMLRRLAPLLTTKAPWEPRPEAVNRRRVAAPYSAKRTRAVVAGRSAPGHATSPSVRSGPDRPRGGSWAGRAVVHSGGWPRRTSFCGTAWSLFALVNRRLGWCLCWPGGRTSSSGWRARPVGGSWLGGHRWREIVLGIWPGSSWWGMGTRRCRRRGCGLPGLWATSRWGLGSGN